MIEAMLKEKWWRKYDMDIRQSVIQWYRLASEKRSKC